MSNINLTEEQINLLKGCLGRSSFYPREVDAIFEFFIQSEGWNPGCKTCPSNLTFVKDRIEGKLRDYLSEMDKEQERILSALKNAKLKVKVEEKTVSTRKRITK